MSRLAAQIQLQSRGPVRVKFGWPNLPLKYLKWQMTILKQAGVLGKTGLCRIPSSTPTVTWLSESLLLASEVRG